MTFAEHRLHYRRNHQTIGCRLTHMVGVPLILFSLPAFFFFGAACGLGSFVVGWFLQFLGHFAFEGNKPVLFGNPSNPYTYFYAIIFVLEEWWKLLTFQSMRD